MLHVGLLVFDAEVKGMAVRGVQPTVAPGPPLADDHGQLGVAGVLVLTPCVEVLQTVYVPAVIKVPPHNVHQIEAHLMIEVGHVEGHHARPCGILLLQSLLQPLRQCDGALPAGGPFRFVGSGDGEQNLVHVTPGDDGRVVVVLAYHLAQVQFAVVGVPRRVRHDIDDGNLLPGQQPQFVTQFQHSVVLRIVGDAHEVTSQFFHQTYIPTVALIIQCHTYRPLVLMAVHAPQLVRLSVKKESLVAVKGEPAEAHLVVCLSSSRPVLGSTSAVSST